MHFGASNVANFVLGTAIRPQNMTGSSTKRMNEFAMRRTGEREKWETRDPLTIPMPQPTCCALLRSCLREMPRMDEGEEAGKGNGGLQKYSCDCCRSHVLCALRVHVKCHNQTQRNKSI